MGEMQKRYQLPAFLEGQCDQATYEKWLRRAASRHVRRDRKRGNSRANGEAYRLAIHQAVTNNGQHDAYTGEQLDWDLISTYDNKAAKAGGRTYKKSFGLLATVDHVGDGLGSPDFRICAWRTNDAKHDLTLDEFVKLCTRVIKHQESSGDRR